MNISDKVSLIAKHLSHNGSTIAFTSVRTNRGFPQSSLVNAFTDLR